LRDSTIEFNSHLAVHQDQVRLSGTNFHAVIHAQPPHLTYLSHKYRVVIWCKHGVIARSDQSVKRAADRIEYGETGARYEYMNLVNDDRGEGLTADEIRAICQAFDVQQNIF